MPSTHVLTPCADAPYGRAAASVAVVGSKAYVLGGRIGADWSYPQDVWVYDAPTDTWTTVGTTPFSGRSNMAIAAINGSIYSGGGFAGDTNDAAAYKSDWWKFDGTQWTQLPDIPTSYANGLITFTIGDIIYLGYGYNHLWSAELFAFDTRTDTWSANMQPDFTELRIGMALTCAYNQHHVFAGLGFDSNNSNQWSEYDLTTNRWQSRAPMPKRGRVFSAATAIETHVFIAGGRHYGGSLTTGKIYDEIWSYDISTDNWSHCATLPSPMENMVAFTIDNIPYFGLGEDADGNRSNHLFKILPHQ